MKRIAVLNSLCLFCCTSGLTLWGFESSSTDAAPIRLDTRVGTRYAQTEEEISFSTDWNEGTTRLVLNIDGANVLTATTVTNGVYLWKPDLSTSGTVTLSHTTRGTINEALTATFTIRAYDILFKSGIHGAFIPGIPATQRIPHGEAAVEPTVEPSAGYRFAGWSSSTSNVTSDQTVTAQYTAIDYSLTYEDLKGARHTNPLSYTIEKAIVFEPPSSIPEGWRFVCWEPSSITVGTTGAQNIRAVWERIYLETVFDPGQHGGLKDGSVMTQRVAYGESAALPLVVPAPGYRFKGWSADTSAVKSNVTVTAQYEIIPYAITYENLQGATHVNPSSYTVEDAITFTPPGSLSRYRFIRWNPGSIALGTIGNQTVVATWEELSCIYVDAKYGNDANNGNEPEQAVKTLSRAYALAQSGDEILVAKGTYSPITATGKSVTFRALDGAIIDGGGKRRCVTADGAVVFENFTLQKGYDEESGGGAKGGTFNRCIIKDCYSGWDGGGTYESTLRNCLIVGNIAEYGYGGGVYGGTLVNCTVAGNSAGDEGGGVYAAETMKNTIVSGNKADQIAGSLSADACSNWIGDGAGFVSVTKSDYQLAKDSPCRDAGSNDGVKGELDLAGNVRIANRRVDIGAYEYIADGLETGDGVGETQSTDVPVPYSWLREHFPSLGDDAANYEAKACETAANGHKVWECFVAGEDPNDAENKFAASISMMDGRPVITWSPDLGEERAYSIFGKAELNGAWKDVTAMSPEERAARGYRFFSVRVEMK